MTNSTQYRIILVFQIAELDTRLKRRKTENESPITGQIEKKNRMLNQNTETQG